MYILTIIFIVLLCLFSFLPKNNVEIKEGYYDITPYEFHWDIFKCYDDKCLRKKAKECYDWCNNWGETGGRHNCRMRCLDYADQQAEHLKLGDYFFHRNLPKIKYRAIHRPFSEWF